jgi:hypothetical protein
VVEGPRVERERLRRRSDQLDLGTEPAVCDRQHLGALIDPGHREPLPQQLRRDEPGPGRHVENATAARQARDEEAAPARVLPQREHRADPVVRRPERREQLAGLLFPAPCRHPWCPHPTNHPISAVGSATCQQARDF